MTNEREDNLSWEDPFTVAWDFMNTLLVDPGDVERLCSLVLPERAFLWPWPATAEVFAVTPPPRMVRQARRAFEAPDVAYVYVRNDDDSSEQLGEDYWADLVTIITLVWRPELDGWFVVTIGQEVPPDKVPRTSPGIAPQLT